MGVGGVKDAGAGAERGDSGWGRDSREQVEREMDEV